MTHKQLEEIRKRAELATQVPADGENATLVAAWVAAVLLSSSDVLVLVNYINELHCIVHDIRQEPGYVLGRQEECRVLATWLFDRYMVFRKAEDEFAEPESEVAEFALRALEFVQARPVSPAPHLAPDDLRRENEELRACLRKACNLLQIPFHSCQHGALHDCLTEARRLLGE